MKAKFILTLSLIMATMVSFGQTFDYSLNYNNIKVGKSGTGVLQFNGLATFLNSISVPDLATTDSSGKAANTKFVKQAIRSSRIFYNVKDYGAIGDSVTNDRQSFVNAINAIPESGGTLFIPAGKYRIPEGITINKNIHILGEGKGWKYNTPDMYYNSDNSAISSIIFTSATSACFTFTETFPSYVEKIDIKYKGSAPAEGNTPLRFLSGFGMTVRDCSFDNFFDGIRIEDRSAEYLVDNCKFSSIHRYGMYLDNSSIPDYGDQSITNNIITGITATPGNEPLAAIYVRDGGGLRIIGNKFNNAPFKKGIHVDSFSGATSILVVVGNSFEWILEEVIKTEPGTVFGNIIVTGNEIINYTETISNLIDLGGSGVNGVISSNILVSTTPVTGFYAIRLASGMQKFKISDNTYGNNFSNNTYVLDESQTNQVLDKVFFSSTGKIGLNTDNATHNLTINSNTSENYIALKHNENPVITYGTDGVGKFIVYDNDNSAYRLVMDGSGNLSIGNTSVSGSSKLDVNGKIKFGPGTFTPNTGALYTDEIRGAVFTGFAGSSSEFFMANSSGSEFLKVPTGTVNAEMSGGLKVASAPIDPTDVVRKQELDNSAKWQGESIATSSKAVGDIISYNGTNWINKSITATAPLSWNNTTSNLSFNDSNFMKLNTAQTVTGSVTFDAFQGHISGTLDMTGGLLRNLDTGYWGRIAYWDGSGYLGHNTIAGILGYTPADVNDVTANYLPLSGGDLTGDLDIDGYFTVAGNISVGEGQNHIGSFRFDESTDGGGNRFTFQELYGSNTGAFGSMVFSPNIFGNTHPYWNTEGAFTGSKKFLLEGDIDLSLYSKVADTVSSAPTPTSTGVKGQKIYNSGYIYECIATNTWVRHAVETTW